MHISRRCLQAAVAVLQLRKIRTLHTNANALGRVRIKKPYPSNKRLLDATCPIRCVSSVEKQRRAITDTRVHPYRFGSLRGFVVPRCVVILSPLAFCIFAYCFNEEEYHELKSALDLLRLIVPLRIQEKNIFHAKWTGVKEQGERIFQNPSIRHVYMK